MAGGRCLCSQTVDFDAPAGTLVAGLAVLPELPAGVDTVSVAVASLHVTGTPG